MKMHIEATCPELENASFAAEYDLGGTLDEAAALFGEEAVYTGYLKSAIIQVQAWIRALARAGKTVEEIQETVTGRKIGVSAVRGADPITSIMGKFDKMKEADKKAFIEKLLAKQAE